MFYFSLLLFFRFFKIFTTYNHFLRYSAIKKAELNFHNVIRCAGCAERLILGKIDHLSITKAARFIVSNEARF